MSDALAPDEVPTLPVQLHWSRDSALLLVGGQEVTRQVSSLHFEAEGGPSRGARLGLVLRDPEFTFEGDAVVYVDRPGTVDESGMRALVGAWLDTIDPQALEEAVLNHPEADLGNSTGTLFLTVLRRMAAGEQT